MEDEKQPIRSFQRVLQMGILGRIWPSDQVVLGLRVCQLLREELLEHTSTVCLARQGNGHACGWMRVSTVEHIAKVLGRFAGKTLHLTWKGQGVEPTMMVLQGMSMMMPALGSNLVHVDLCANNFRNEGAEKLAQCFPAPRLVHLDLTKNNIGAAGMAALSKNLHHSTQLSHLHLRSNKIRSEGAKSLSAALRPCCALSLLSLAGNDIRAEGMTSLAGVLPSFPHLANLDLRWNEIRVKGASKLAAVLGTCTALTQLDLAGNALGDRGVARLAPAVGQCRRLRSLGLDATKLTDEGARSLATVMGECSALQQLGLGQNAFSHVGTMVLVRALRDRTAMVSFLDLRWSYVGAEGATALAKALGEERVVTGAELGRLRVCQSATALAKAGAGMHLDLSGNVVGNEGARQLAAFMGSWPAPRPYVAVQNQLSTGLPVTWW